MDTFRRRTVAIAAILALLRVAANAEAEPGPARSINISSSWWLPRNDFLVFYRHFKDRVTWFEADAVCQFHHAQLVTVESTNQFEVMRGYLKELDVTENVWIGLKRNSEASEFTWTNYQPLARSGYFREEVPRSSEPVCVVSDPTANFKWHSLHCGGPEVASFVCELPVPNWASKSDGCMTSMVEGMTVTFLPEHPAVQLTKECSSGVSKNVTCKGNMKQSEIIERLSCPNTNILLKTLYKPVKPSLADVKTKTTTSNSESDVEDYVEMATIAQYNDETFQSISKVMGRDSGGTIGFPQEMSIAQEPIKSRGRNGFDTNGIDSAFIAAGVVATEATDNAATDVTAAAATTVAAATDAAATDATAAASTDTFATAAVTDVSAAAPTERAKWPSTVASVTATAGGSTTGQPAATVRPVKTEKPAAVATASGGHGETPTPTTFETPITATVPDNRRGDNNDRLANAVDSASAKVRTVAKTSTDGHRPPTSTTPTTGTTPATVSTPAMTSTAATGQPTRFVDAKTTPHTAGADAATVTATSTTRDPIRVYKKIDLPPMFDVVDFPYKPNSVATTASFTSPVSGSATTAAATAAATSVTAKPPVSTSTARTAPPATTTVRTTTTAAVTAGGRANATAVRNAAVSTTTAAPDAFDDPNSDQTPSMSPTTGSGGPVTDATTAAAAAATSSVTAAASHRKPVNYDSYVDHPNRSRHIVRPKQQHHHSYPYILYRLLG